jgi:hypothetical protein
VSVLAKGLEKAVKDPDYVQFCQKIAYQPVFKDARGVREEIKLFEEKIGPKLAVFYQKK